MFVAKNIVRMHDTDMAGILYFPRQFRFIHDAWEDLMEVEGLSFQKLFTDQDWAFVVAHAESDYLKPLQVGNPLEVQIQLEKIGNTSFTLKFSILREEELVGTGKTVHVTIDRITRKKIRVPDELRKKLEKYKS